MTTAEVVSAPRAPVCATGRPRVVQERFWRWWAVLSTAAVGGPVLIGGSFAQAIRTGRPAYLMFWAGVLGFMIATVAFVGSRRARRDGLLTVVVASGLFLYIPKILRNPFGPVYHDELAHWRQVQDIAASGHLFVSNTTIPIIQSYPGLHIVTLTVQEITGLSTWASAVVLLAVLHVMDLVAVFLIVEGFTHSARGGAIGAILYSLNSSYMYFHTQFAYESLGVTLFLLAIVAVQHVERAPDRAVRYRWAGVAAIVGASCAVTHHLSTLCLCLVLIGWSAIALHRGRRDSDAAAVARAVVAVTSFVVAFLGSWIVLVAPGTVTYLQPYLGQAAAQLTKTLGGGQGGRTPFAQNANPTLERIGAFASPLLMLIIAGLTVRHLRSRRHQTLALSGPGTRPPSGLAALFAFGLLYFPSIPFLLAPSGAEGARRTWGFTYLGVAIIVTPTLARWLDKWWQGTAGARVARRSALIGALVVIMVGNVAAGLDESYRFPGPYTLGSDTGSLTPELAALSQWFPATVGTKNNVVADRFTGVALGAFGRQTLDAPSAGFPTFQLWLNRSAPSPALIKELSSSGYRYLVVDERMTLPVSELTNFFAGTSAGSSDGTTVVTLADLNRFTRYGWLTRVYASPDFSVYRFQYGSLGLPAAPRPHAT